MMPMGQQMLGGAAPMNPQFAQMMQQMQQRFSQMSPQDMAIFQHNQGYGATQLPYSGQAQPSGGIYAGGQGGSMGRPGGQFGPPPPMGGIGGFGGGFSGGAGIGGMMLPGGDMQRYMDLQQGKYPAPNPNTLMNDWQMRSPAINLAADPLHEMPPGQIPYGPDMMSKPVSPATLGYAGHTFGGYTPQQLQQNPSLVGRLGNHGAQMYQNYQQRPQPMPMQAAGGGGNSMAVSQELQPGSTLSLEQMLGAKPMPFPPQDNPATQARPTRLPPQMGGVAAQPGMTSGTVKPPSSTSGSGSTAGWRQGGAMGPPQQVPDVRPAPTPVATKPVMQPNTLPSNQPIANKLRRPPGRGGA